MDCLVSVQGSKRQRTIRGIQIPYQNERLRNGCATFPCASTSMWAAAARAGGFRWPTNHSARYFSDKYCLDSGGCKFLFLLLLWCLIIYTFWSCSSWGQSGCRLGVTPCDRSSRWITLFSIRCRVRFTMFSPSCVNCSVRMVSKPVVPVVGYYAISHTPNRDVRHGNQVESPPLQTTMRKHSEYSSA